MPVFANAATSGVIAGSVLAGLAADINFRIVASISS